MVVWKVEWQHKSGHTVTISFVDAPEIRVKKYTQQLDEQGVKYTLTKTEEQ